MREKFLNKFALGSGLSLIKLIAGLAKVKVLAIQLGVEGVGLLSLGLQFQSTLIAFLSMSLAVGVINLGRPELLKGEVKIAGAILGTALVLVIFNSMLALSIFFIFRDKLSEIWLSSFFIDGIYSFWPLMLAAIFVSFSNVLWEGLSFLVDRFDIYVRSNMMAAVCDAAFFSIGALIGGVKGAFLASLISSISLFFIYFICSGRVPVIRKILRDLATEKLHIKPLLSYSALMLATTGMGLACLFLARAYLTSVTGDIANGYLQVVTALAAYMLPFIMSGVHGHMHPIVVASGDTAFARIELRKTLIASLRLSAVGCSILIIFAPLLVKMFYTKAFLGSWQFIPVYFFGELFFIFLSILGVYLLGDGQKKLYLIGNIIYYITLLIVVVLATKNFGVWAYVMAHVISSIAAAFLASIYCFRNGLLDLTTLKTASVLIFLSAVFCWIDYFGLEIMVGNFLIRITWLLGPALVLFASRPYLRLAWKLPR